jgi:hypothetical protein
MPNKGTMQAKQKRAGSLGQTSRLYKLGNTNKKVAGGQGFGRSNPSIGSMTSLQTTKQVRKAGGSNICDRKDYLGTVINKTKCNCLGPNAQCNL